MENSENTFKKQTGGTHYKGLAITPAEYAMKNKLDACQFSVVKYVTRFRDKNGLEDLKKAKDFIDMLIESEYPTNDNDTHKVETEYNADMVKPTEYRNCIVTTQHGKRFLARWCGNVWMVSRWFSRCYNVDNADTIMSPWVEYTNTTDVIKYWRYENEK